MVMNPARRTRNDAFFFMGMPLGVGDWRGRDRFGRGAAALDALAGDNGPASTTRAGWGWETTRKVRDEHGNPVAV